MLIALVRTAGGADLTDVNLIIAGEQRGEVGQIRIDNKCHHALRLRQPRRPLEAADRLTRWSTAAVR